MQKSEQLTKVSIRLVSDPPLMSEKKLNSPDAAVELLGDYIAQMDREVLCVLNFNNVLQPINCNVVSIGTINSSVAAPREIMKSAVLSNASYMMIMHNHPSGNLTPSRDDIKITQRMIDACEIMGIPLLDHIIVGPRGKDFFSLKEKKTIEFGLQKKYQTDMDFIKFNTDPKVAEWNKSR